MKVRFSKYWVNIFIMILYLVMGMLIILRYSVWQDQSDIKLSLFGVVVIIYGIFRGYRAYKVYQSQKEEQDEKE